MLFLWCRLFFGFFYGAGVVAAAAAAANIAFPGLLSSVHDCPLVYLWFISGDCFFGLCLVSGVVRFFGFFYGAGVAAAAAATFANMVFPGLLCMVHVRSLVYIR
ncbi:uncharacterized protein ATC70_012516 [Mucor velutinosus]|uniref:Uncharacterized protein n=1 Tax=Mucor velutinosus TaxID=708070 RepID=A0AAN7DB61_9FUNG|nr:hypothetical protein ATC70_012516 [Mucor velutinosus]